MLPVISKTKHLAYLLKVDWKEIESIMANINSFYGERIEIKKDDYGNPKLDRFGLPKKRIINPSKRRLKVIQRRLNKNILAKIEMPNYAHGAVKGRSNITNAKKHQGKKYKFTTDLKDFFPSISNGRVFDMFLENGFSPTVARVLTKLTTYRGCIPQGAPTSSTVANLVFIRSGNILYNLAQKHSLTFTSFVDDLTFSSSRDFKLKIPQILEIIKEEFRISHKKTNYSRNPNVTGLHPMNNHVKTPQSFDLKLADLNNKTLSQIEGLLQYRESVIRANSKKAKY